MRAAGRRRRSLRQRGAADAGFVEAARRSAGVTGIEDGDDIDAAKIGFLDDHVEFAIEYVGHRIRSPSVVGNQGAVRRAVLVADGILILAAVAGVVEQQGGAGRRGFSGARHFIDHRPQRAKDRRPRRLAIEQDRGAADAIAGAERVLQVGYVVGRAFEGFEAGRRAGVFVFSDTDEQGLGPTAGHGAERQGHQGDQDRRRQ